MLYDERDAEIEVGRSGHEVQLGGGLRLRNGRAVGTEDPHVDLLAGRDDQVSHVEVTVIEVGRGQAEGDQRR